HTFAISRRNAPEFCCGPSPSLGRGRAERRVPDAPAASCALVKNAHEFETTVTPENIRRSARDGVNGLCRALPGARPGFWSPSHPTEETGLRWKPSLRRGLMPRGTSGPHAFAVRSSVVVSASV
ncbi:unnamed protein product, partial [Phaeothamnion confervicola]